MKTTFLPLRDAHSQKEMMKKIHRLRHDIFIQKAGREDLRHWNKLEYDVWDTGLFDAVYVLLEDDQGEPIGVARLISTQEITLMEAKYFEFLDRPHDKSPDFWEIQRLGVRFDMDPIKIERAILFLLSEIALWLLTHNVVRVMLITYTGIADKRLQKMERMGPELTRAGAPLVALQGYLDRGEIDLWMARYHALTNKIENPSQAA